MASHTLMTSSSVLKHEYGANYFEPYQPDTPDHQKRLAMYAQEHARILSLISSGRVLDVGCGTGDFLAMFDQRRWTRFGIDVSDYALQIAATKGIDIAPPEGVAFFDLIVWRGTFQHLDEPMSMLMKCIEWLKPGGYLVFLATPNSGSFCYRLFQDLPMLDAPRNFVVVSDRILTNILRNLGMDVVHVHFPYRGSPYASPLRDCANFVLRCLGFKRKFAFWGNVMEVYGRKPEQDVFK